jgi:hypothetical protein
VTPAEYVEWFKNIQAKQLEITIAKNSDYTGATNDAFANFKQIGALVPIIGSIELGFLTRMSDKMSRIGSFLSKGSLQVKDESVEDTLLDLSIYCILFLGYLKSQQQKEIKRGDGQ